MSPPFTTGQIAKYCGVNFPLSVLKDRYPGIRAQVIEKTDKGKFLAALRILDDVTRNPIFVTSSVGKLIKEDRADIEIVGRKRLEAALVLIDQGDLEEALHQLLTLRYAFGRLHPLKADINVHIEATKQSLKGLGT